MKRLRVFKQGSRKLLRPSRIPSKEAPRDYYKCLRVKKAADTREEAAQVRSSGWRVGPPSAIAGAQLGGLVSVLVLVCCWVKGLSLSVAN